MTDRQIRDVYRLKLGQSLWIDCLNDWYAVTMLGLIFFDRDDKEELEGQLNETQSFLSLEVHDAYDA